MWTIERITELCKTYCGKANVDFNSPVVLNKRLTKTLGRCHYKCEGGKYYPTRIEISNRLLEIASDKTIEEVIAHECAHYVTCFLTNEDHRHDSIFKQYCAAIGTDNSGTVTKIEYVVDATKTNKYSLYCCGCGKFICGKSRSCKITKQPSSFISKCCGSPLRVEQNW